MTEDTNMNLEGTHDRCEKEIIALEAKVKELETQVDDLKEYSASLIEERNILQSQYAEAVEVLKQLRLWTEYQKKHRPDLSESTLNDNLAKIDAILSSPVAKQAIEIRELEQREQRELNWLRYWREMALKLFHEAMEIIFDAITDEDGIDGKVGKEIMKKIEAHTLSALEEKRKETQ